MHVPPSSDNNKVCGLSPENRHRKPNSSPGRPCCYRGQVLRLTAAFSSSMRSDLPPRAILEGPRVKAGRTWASRRQGGATPPLDGGPRGHPEAPGAGIAPWKTDGPRLPPGGSLIRFTMRQEFD
ncbi:hypothetical protein KM043_005956 [Ampulex compressa]|nr:hypothetical protein KM043_005956 [Ampulex compressa]